MDNKSEYIDKVLILPVRQVLERIVFRGGLLDRHTLLICWTITNSVH